MKKILSLIIALSLLMSLMLLSCKKETAESLVRDAFAKVDSHNAIENDMNLEIIVSMGGIEIEVITESKLKAIGELSDLPTTHMVTTTSVFGEKNTTEEYSEGEWTYTIEDGVATKAKREDDSSEEDDLNFDIPSEVFEGVEIVRNEDGTKTVEFILTADVLRESFAGLRIDLVETLEGDGVTDAEFSDANVKVTVKKGDISELTVLFDINMLMMGMEVTAKCNIKIDFITFDDDVKITPPDGYLGFPEV